MVLMELLFKQILALHLLQSHQATQMVMAMEILNTQYLVDITHYVLKT
jgi:hypothetical protein